MSEIVTSTTAALIASATAVLNQPAPWPSPAQGLAFRILVRAGMALPAGMTQSMRETSAALMRRTPEIAAFGYVIDRADPAVRTLWVDAVEHLRGREIYPGDRNSFVFNPLELLGLAVGLLVTDRPDHRDWLGVTLSRGLRQGQFRAPISLLAAKVALAAVDPVEFGKHEAVPMIVDDLNTSDLMLAAAVQLVFGELTEGDADRTEKAFLSQALRRSIVIGDAAEAAAVIVMATRAIDRACLDPVAASSADLIAALCRRLPWLVERLGKRQRQREPLLIRDEYDVQDLLHGILRLHFDDVRPEEWTPSYAGNSSRVDFFLPRERIVVEAKMTRAGLGQKEVVNELLIDISRYARMETVDTLICLIYDPDRRCGNPATIENDLAETSGRLGVKAIVCPSGL